MGLLKKDPTQRLGSPLKGGTDAVKSHPFFKDVDWSKVMLKTHGKPPIRPKVKHDGDVKHVDKQYLK